MKNTHHMAVDVDFKWKIDFHVREKKQVRFWESKAFNNWHSIWDRNELLLVVNVPKIFPNFRFSTVFSFAVKAVGLTRTENSVRFYLHIILQCNFFSFFLLAKTEVGSHFRDKFNFFSIPSQSKSLWMSSIWKKKKISLKWVVLPKGDSRREKKRNSVSKPILPWKLSSFSENRCIE